MPAFVKEINALRTDIETSFLEVVDGKNLNEYNAPGYEAAVKSVNKKYMHAILNHYDVNLSDERLSKVHRAASVLEKEHRLLQHGKIKKISDDIETKFDNAFLETGMSTKHTESRALFSKRGGEDDEEEGEEDGEVPKRSRRLLFGKKARKKAKKGLKKIGKKFKKGEKSRPGSKKGSKSSQKFHKKNFLMLVKNLERNLRKA